jgi:2-iminobutanoate/2-iminopropanoate deaminase
MNIQLINPKTVASPKGHYSPAVVHNGVVYVAGQLPIDVNGNIQIESIEVQTNLCLQNIESILKEAGSDLNHLLKVNIFVSDITLWPRINETYSKILGNHKPARIVVPCNPLNYGCQIEIDAIAAVIEIV